MNLLQPQDSRSRRPGDSAAAVAARHRLHARGVTAPLLAAIASLLEATPRDTVLDAGCGDGFYLGNIAHLSGCAGFGVDISKPSVDAAARKYPACQWIAANADRFLPWADGSFSAVLSITARRNPGEFRRVLEKGGRLLLAVPAADDLIYCGARGVTGCREYWKNFPLTLNCWRRAAEQPRRSWTARQWTTYCTPSTDRCSHSRQWLCA